MTEDGYILGAIVSPADLRDYEYDMLIGASEPIEVPYEYIFDYPYDILNQGAIGSCVAHGLSEMRNYIDGVPIDDTYSVGFIYANREESDSQNRGMVTRQALKNLVKYGDCKKKDFPINEEYPAIVKTLEKYGKDQLLKKASEHKSLAYIKLQTNEIKEYLVKYKKPIAIAVYVYDNFYEANTNGGKIPSKPSGNKRGGHLMIIIGYKGDDLVIVNSWGENVGDKGRFYLDINSEIIKELWALEDILNVNRPVKKTYTIGWNKSVVNGVTKWSYSNEGKTLLKNSWIKPKDKWYYIGSDTYAYDNQWLLYNGYWYFLKKDSCEMASSEWCLWKNKWYWLNEDGKMRKSDWLLYKGYWYYLKSDGIMVTGTQNINGKFYDFDSEGRMIKEY
nr:MAG TPA: peptidase [Caudoviricetes sp.]